MNYINGTIHPIGQQFASSILAAAGLFSLVQITTMDALDALNDKTAFCNDKKAYKALRSAEFELQDINSHIPDVLAHSTDGVWMADFGNAVYGKVKDIIAKLEYATENHLGRQKKIQALERQAIAKLLVAHLMASRATMQVDKDSNLFSRGLKVANRKGSLVCVRHLLANLSCKRVENSLRSALNYILTPLLEDDFDLTADTSIRIGCNAITEILYNPETWAYAIDKAEKLNTKQAVVTY